MNHACSWKGNALKKVESRIRGEEARYHSDSSLEDMNRQYYGKARGRSRQDTIASIDLLFAYAYYAIRNDDYEVFLEVERYVSKYRSSAFADMSLIDIKGIADAARIKEIFDRG